MDLTLESTALVALLDWSAARQRALSLTPEQWADPTVRAALMRIQSVMRPYYLDLTTPLERPVPEQASVLAVLEQVAAELEAHFGSAAAAR